MILLDMDGVLVDINKAAHKLLKLSCDPWPYHYTKFDVYPSSFWSQVANDREWWARLPWHEDGRAILEACLAVDDVTLCTSILGMPGAAAAAGKLDWIERELPSLDVMFVNKKEILATRGVLVDDRPATITAFRYARGTAIMVPRPWNILRKINTIETVKLGLRKVYDGIHSS